MWLAANGAGCPRAAAAVEAGRGVCEPEAVVSAGFCGAPRGAPGGGFGGRGDGGGERPAKVAGAAGNRRHPFDLRHDLVFGAGGRDGRGKEGPGGDGGLRGGNGGRRRGRTRPGAGLPFYCIRAVTDLADENMANDFNAALRSDGHFDTIKILGSSLRHPWARLPELIRLRRRCASGRAVLGDFIADCRF